MKTFHLLIVTLSVCASSFASPIHSTEKVNAYDHLFDVNKEWRHHSYAAPNEITSFDTDISRIAFHLTLVEKTLRAETPASLDETTKLRRLQLLDELKGYAERRLFPTNLYHKERTPYFIDDFGVHCAVGYLIKVSGHPELSKTISSEHNYDYLRDIKTEGVKEWAEYYGFELSELAWIQPGYELTNTCTNFGDGFDGPVNVMCEDPANNRILIGGNYTTADNSACSGVAVLQNDQLSCLGSEMTGTVNSIHLENDGTVVACGNFSVGPTMHPIARFENNNWSYVSIPSRQNAIVLDATDESGFALEVVLKTATGTHEIWGMDELGNWTHEATADGPITSMDASSTQVAFGGDFDQVIIHGPVDQAINGKNAIIRDLGNSAWTAPSGWISESVLDVAWIDSTFYWVGTCDQADQTTTPISYLGSNGQIQSWDQAYYALNGNAIEIRKIRAHDSRVLVSGQFAAGMMYFGQSIAFLQVDQPLDQAPWAEPVVNVYGPVNDFIYTAEGLNIGGEFTFAYQSSNLNNIARVDGTAGLTPIEPIEVTTFPNPATEEVVIYTNSTVERATLINLRGEVVLETGSHLIDVSQIPAGMYVIQVETVHGEIGQGKLMVKH